MMTADEAIKAYRDFEQRSSSRYSEQMDRIKEDRDFLSGTQWSTEDDKLIDKARCRRTVNVLGNSINAVANSYSQYPYKWWTGDQEIDKVLDSFMVTKSNARAPQLALRSSVAYGLGVMVLGSEKLHDVEVPCLYSLANICDVRLDPDSVEPDGSDAMEAAIIEMRSKEYIKAKYGDEYVVSNDSRASVDIAAPHDANQQAIVTYYKVEDGQCSVYKLLGNDFLGDPVQLPLDRVPIFTVTGEPLWVDDKVMYQGLVRKGAPVQRIINYCYTQLGERLAKAPKDTWVTTVEAVENLSDGYKRFDRNSNPLLLYNRTTSDGKTVLEPPKREDNKVQYDDINAIIGSNLELLSSITGVDSKGIIDPQSSLTATEVLYNERSAQTNIRHYFDNLRAAMKSAGDAILQMLGVDGMSVDVVQGPEENLARQVARQELTQLTAMVPDDKKMALVNGILASHNDNMILQQVFAQLNNTPAPSATEQQAMQTVEEMKKAIAERDQQLQEMQEQIKAYESAAQYSDKSLQADFVKLDMQHKFDQEDMILKAQLEQGKDADQARAEAIKSRMELVKQAIGLDTARVKAETEKAKAVASVAPVQTSEVIYEA